MASPPRAFARKQQNSVLPPQSGNGDGSIFQQLNRFCLSVQTAQRDARTAYTPSIVAIDDETSGLVFPARIELSQQHVTVTGRRERLSAGMAVTAEIMTGRRRIIEFLLSSIARRVEEAGRER